jgi:hypothetical protein
MASRKATASLLNAIDNSDKSLLILAYGSVRRPLTDEVYILRPDPIAGVSRGPPLTAPSELSIQISTSRDFGRLPSYSSGSVVNSNG